MNKLISYCLVFSCLLLVLAACHMQEDQPDTYESSMDTSRLESSERKEETDDTLAAEHGIPGEKESSAPTLEILEADYILPNSDSHLYSQVVLEQLSPEQMKLARNEIYARHGRQFKDKALQEYFQSKTWYQGTVEPDKFDDSLLNQIEHDNLKLLLRLEQDIDGKALESPRQEDYREDEPITVGYTDIVNKNQYRQMYLSTEEEFDDNVQIRSQIFDHGTYFEVTHGIIFADTCYELSVMEGKGVGDTLKLDNALYRITDKQAWCLENGENVYLEYVSGKEEGYYVLVRNYKDNYYTLVGDNANTQKDTLYKGSLYVRKDCITTVKDPEHEYKDHSVDISDYLTQSKKVVGSQFGLYPSGGLVLWGDFKIDSSGYIIIYSEYFLP